MNLGNKDSNIVHYYFHTKFFPLNDCVCKLLNIIIIIAFFVANKSKNECVPSSYGCNRWNATTFKGCFTVNGWNAGFEITNTSGSLILDFGKFLVKFNVNSVTVTIYQNWNNNTICQTDKHNMHWQDHGRS